ncbi:MAG: DUF4468 domain-containing protein [Chitinophagaceae bacterium]
MIKQLLFTLYLALGMSPFLQAQDTLMYGIFPVSNGRIIYEKTIAVDSVPKDELFKRSKEWAANVYKAQKDTGQIENQDQGILVYNGFVTASFTEPKTRVAADWYCWQTINIVCAENKAKLTITDLEQRSPSGYGSINIVKIEEMKNRTDSIPKSAFFGKNNKARYWKTELVTLKEVDHKIKALIESLEESLKLK